ncbi:glutamate--cysteine ligase [Saccharobesus litoralis]|uniref:Glutamate--cysteine ligase n=1 Tax=Saccharobesus litoralis TaxID=2172099 RepID=A0A2S0VUF6_9ALTE|nr:glutamate--cysteine ligase [Saccharobesus litoralis]AWB67851.1 glutamate--cysteine ligase [Saccharobesus litoralis]
MSVANQALSSFLMQQGKSFFSQFNRGLERESLRINAEGKLSPDSHPECLGSALTNPHITTDYSETLLEFITPVEQNVTVSLQQLADIQKFTYQKINGELLWPMSMPCFVGGEQDIVIAQYGSSNIGKMKTLYREGLRHRYGSMMQVISGVHFNFSFPEQFWQNWAKTVEANPGCEIKDPISEGYLCVIRNLKRHMWILPYLFGASPALCSSFLSGKEVNLPFEKVGKGTLYLPYATSLRLSDLGYTNDAQADLNIEYNCLYQYIDGLRRAINLPSAEYEKIGVKVNGEYRQLNANVLQIENEFYSSVRPKRVTNSGESPTDALERRGIQYMEVRALDVDPFSPEGVNEQQIRFIDLFLMWCALGTNKAISQEEQLVNDQNFDKVILQGRNPDLKLQQFCHEAPADVTELTLTEWASAILDDLTELAAHIDAVNDDQSYMAAINAQRLKVEDPSATPSGKIMNILLNENLDNGALGMRLAEQYKKQQQQTQYQVYSEQYLTEQAQASHARQREVEQSDTVNFDVFLDQYFSKHTYSNNNV